MFTYVLSLADPLATLEIVGGKGMSLARLSRAGLPVPSGFHITTEAYRRFVSENNLQPHILELLKTANPAEPTSLEPVSQRIGELFASSSIPADVLESISAMLNPLQNRAVAVRSSATAEDLPGASFAGQQETFLNIRGVENILAAVKKCWASLWTARAIAYRSRQGIDSDSIALAVVIQDLVFAESAGVLFTANPVTGKRNELMLTAAWGLGEAIVSGAVTPDTLLIEKGTCKISHRETTHKQVMTTWTETGTIEVPVPDHKKKADVLTDRQAAELARLGIRIESLYGMPMDIEWVWTASQAFAIVQARPITALPVEWAPPDPKGIYMRTSIADLMPKPLSPLFITWGIPTMLAMMGPMGERLTRSKPVLQEDYFTSIHTYAYMNAAFPAGAWWWILTGLLPAYPRMLPRLVQIWRDELHPEYKALVAEYQGKDPANMSMGELWRDAQEILNGATSYIFGLMFATMGASAGSEGLLTRVYNKIAKREGDPEAACLLMGWNNIPVRAEKSLYDLAEWCRGQPGLAAYLLATPSAVLVAQIKQAQAPASVDAQAWIALCERFNDHLQDFGHAVFQLDFAEPLPLDYPEPMIENIKMYLRGEGSNPHVRQHASEALRIQTAEMARNRLKGLKRWVFVKALNWGQSLAEVREDAIAEIGHGYPLLRAMLHELGDRFVQAGSIVLPDDIYYLEASEVKNALSLLEQGKVVENLSDRVEQRKAFSQKIAQETPPPMIPMMKKYMGFDTSVWLAESESNRAGSTLKGVPTSAGKVTASACVLHGPEDFAKMQAGDVLVAGTTTPAWTPLFAMASAVVTDIGGPLSHGSIVAREYGIPAVMGTGVATRRIQDGQTITVDGSAGTVMLLS